MQVHGFCWLLLLTYDCCIRQSRTEPHCMCLGLKKEGLSACAWTVKTSLHLPELEDVGVWSSLRQVCVLRRQGYFYYIFGFCFIVGVLTVLITVEVSLVCTYVQLCAEDYLWWWRHPCRLVFLIRVHIGSMIDVHAFVQAVLRLVAHTLWSH